MARFKTTSKSNTVFSIKDSKYIRRYRKFRNYLLFSALLNAILIIILIFNNY